MNKLATVGDVLEQTPTAGSILSVIARAASDPNVDVDKLERLLAMQERLLSRQSEQAFNVALRAAQEAIRPVLKNKENKETRSTYADLEQVSNLVDPVIRQHGFTLSYGTDQSPLADHYRVTCKVSHESGFSRDYQADVPIDNTGPKGSQNKTRTHGFGSALSYGRRYLKLMIFDVRTTDDDGNAAGLGEPINGEQVKVLNGLADEVGGDKAAFCRFLKIDKIQDLPAFRYVEAVNVLRRKNPAVAERFLTGAAQ